MEAGASLSCPDSRRREHMVGVNMALAECIEFKNGLYKSCGIECFEGIMLEPWVRPISVLRFWISEGSTQAES